VSPLARRRRVRSGLAVAAALACAGLACGGLAGAAAPQTHATTQSPPRAAPGTLFSADDLQFLAHMIVHHEQALALAELVPGRSPRDVLQRFAHALDAAQRAEIDHMRGLLRLAAERGIAVPESHLHGDPPMAGMLSRAQMAAIAAARGADFERLWLEGMILHHEGALDMARAQQEAQFASGHQPYGVDTLVDDMLSVQRGEITQMRRWLAEWGEG
jgi:uncharacterized protein (DUF305 family)